MTRLPRDISGRELSQKLRKYGYQVTREVGSHIRLTSRQTGREHHITIPDHDPLKLGTLNSVLADVAAYLNRSKSEVVAELFR